MITEITETEINIFCSELSLKDILSQISDLSGVAAADADANDEYIVSIASTLFQMTLQRIAFQEKIMIPSNIDLNKSSQPVKIAQSSMNQQRL